MRRSASSGSFAPHGEATRPRTDAPRGSNGGASRESLTRTDRDGHASLVGDLSQRDHRLADAFLGCAILAVIAFAAYRAASFEVSVPVEVEETDGPRSEEP